MRNALCLLAFALAATTAILVLFDWNGEVGRFIAATAVLVVPVATISAARQLSDWIPPLGQRAMVGIAAAALVFLAGQILIVPMAPYSARDDGAAIATLIGMLAGAIAAYRYKPSKKTPVGR